MSAGTAGAVARRRCALLAAAAVGALAPVLTSAAETAAPRVGSGVSAPPFGAQPVPSADGPLVVTADDFTATAPGLQPGQIEMTTTSTRPSLVTGDSVRVAVRGLEDDDVLHVDRDGVDATPAFTPDAAHTGTRTGVVGGLRSGANLLTAVVTGSRGVRSARLVVTSHPLQGPVISGAHQEPFLCETQVSGMGPATSPDCTAATQVRWFARSAVTGQFTRLDDPYGAYPADTATTSTRDGRTVPFVVRVESEVVNRSITRIAVLDDPHARGAARPFAPQEWNHGMVYVFGESCGTGHDQGVLHEDDVLGGSDAGNDNYQTSIVDDLPGQIGKGYLLVMSSLTTLGVHCNPLLSAETMMMVREHIVDDYGPISHTIGMGGSGGAIQQHTTANMYPGLLDAATMIVSFPDLLAPMTTLFDCHVLDSVFAADPLRWDPGKQTAVMGLATPRVCQDLDAAYFGVFQPQTCPAGIPPSQRYDARTNPHGVRCDIWTGQDVIWGVDPRTGFANRPLDDAGLQYGLGALQSGAISADDFITLNRAVGGIDLDGNPTHARTAMPATDAAIAFATGEVTGRGPLDETPIIDSNEPVVDYLPEFDVHDQARSWEMRARLDATFGSHANQAIWTLASLPAPAVDVAEQWLTAVDAYLDTHVGATRAEAVAHARPAEAADQCRLLVTGVAGGCDQGVNRKTSPRQVAGGPLREDSIKCALRPLRGGDYPASLTASQLDQLRAIFPDGVCDWSQQPIGATPRSRAWLSWSDGPPGTAPVTVPYPLVRSAPTAVGGLSAASPARASGLPNTGGVTPGVSALTTIICACLTFDARRRRRGRR